MRPCPFCAELIADDATVCNWCQSRLGVPQPFAGEPETSGKAIASLVCGVAGFVIPILSGIAAIILGHLSLSEIRKSAGRLKGHGIAVAGLVLGYVGVAFVPFILIIAAIAIPNLLRARMAANEASAVGTLRTYETALAAYASQCPDSGFPTATVSLGPGNGDCAHANLIDGVLGVADPVRSGYRFRYTPGPADDRGRIVSFALSADPVQPGTTGTRHFFVDQTDVIRCRVEGPADAESPALQ